jgi:hypothetical protein
MRRLGWIVALACLTVARCFPALAENRVAHAAAGEEFIAEGRQS